VASMNRSCKKKT